MILSLAGFELTTFSSGGRRSIQLSYRPNAPVSYAFGCSSVKSDDIPSYDTRMNIIKIYIIKRYVIENFKFIIKSNDNTKLLTLVSYPFTLTTGSVLAHGRKSMVKRILSLISLIVGVCSVTLFAASPLAFSSFTLQGDMPVVEVFRVEQNQAALNFNLAESMNRIVRVGSFTLVSNNSVSRFQLSIRPGEQGDEEQFAFKLNPGEPVQDGKRSEIPLKVSVSSGTSGSADISGTKAMQKEFGVRSAGNEGPLYETGEILAEIPDFNPDEYATGWYSAAIQLSIVVL